MIINFNNQKPFVEGVDLNDLISTINTPFYVYSQKSIIESYKKINNFINAEIFYSVKANSNQAILALMKNLGAGADVVSIGELTRALKVGMPPNKIIFEGVGKSNRDLDFAITNKIRQINIESKEELFSIESIGKSKNQKVNIGIRINPNIDAKTIEQISTGRKEDKFGIEFDLLSNVCDIIKNSKNINLTGISCHIGSQIHSVEIFEQVFNKMKQAAEIIKSKNLKINYIDLGGGFGVTYKNEKQIDLKKLSSLIKNTFEKDGYKISIEPGRYLVANSGILITKILTTKKNGSINFLITDAGMQTFIRPAMYDAFHKIVPLSTNNQIEKYTIAGPICESTDIIAQNIEIPMQKSGNYLAVCDTGAYGFVMSSNYNTKNLPAEILINEKKHAIIRKEEEILDVIKKDIIPDWK